MNAILEMLDIWTTQLLDLLKQFVGWLGSNPGWVTTLASLVAIVEFAFHPFRWLWRRFFSPSAANRSSGSIVNEKPLIAERDIIQAGRDLTINKRDSLDADTIAQQNRTIEYLQSKLETLESDQGKIRQVGTMGVQIGHAVRDLRNAADTAGIDFSVIREAEKTLAEGDTERAEVLWQRILDKRSASASHINKEAAVAARNLGILAFLHNTQIAIGHYKKSVELDPYDPDGWNQLGLLYLRNSELIAAEDAFKNVLSLAESLNNKFIAGNAIGNLGTVDERLGKTQQAEAKYLRALQLHKEAGDLGGMATEYGSLSALNRRCGRFPEALNLLSEAKRLFSEVDNQDGVVNVEVSEAAILVSLRQFEQAEQRYKKALQYFLSTGHRHDAAYQHANLGNLYLLWQRPIDLSMVECQSALDLFESLESKPGIALASFGLARAYLVKGQLETAARYAQQSLDLYRGTKNSDGIAGSLGIVASVRLNQGDTNSAVSHSDEALAIYQSIDDKEKTAAMLVLKGEICQSRGERTEQRCLYIKALKLYNEIGSPIAGQIQLWIKGLDDCLDD